MKKIDLQLLAPGICIVATSYGLARYAYGLFIPVFRESLALSDSWLAYIAAASYASYFLVTLAGIFLSSRLGPRTSVVAGGLCAAAGMAIIALSHQPLMLALGVMVAGVSPGLAYTPFSEIVVNHVSASRQRLVYSIINSGTSLGVMLSGPVAIFFSGDWRMAWGFFSLFGLLSTVWCASVIPNTKTGSSQNWGKPGAKAIFGVDRVRLFLIAFLIGIATSIYWTFAVDLVTRNVSEPPMFMGQTIGAMMLGQIFWTVVGIAGFAGVFAGSIVNRLGPVRSLALFQLAIAGATVCLSLASTAAPVMLSGLTFGAFFVLMAATLGMWSMELFADRPSIGFGLTFLLLSLGQFVGPSMVGLLIEHSALTTLFMISGGLSFAVILLLPHGLLSQGLLSGRSS